MDSKFMIQALSEVIFKELHKYGDFEFIARSHFEGQLEIVVKDKTDERILFRTILNVDDEPPKEIQIPVLIVLEELRYKGIGKKVISLTHEICKFNGYRLFIVDMVPSFYRKLINRGALPIEGYDDVVEITEYTKLI